MAQVQLKEEPVELQICSGVETPNIKEEPELCIKQELEQFPFNIIVVKSEDDEHRSSVLHPRTTEENSEQTNGAEAGCSSARAEEHTESSSETDHSEEYSQEQCPSKRSYTMIPPDSDWDDGTLLNENDDSSVADVGKNNRQSQCDKGFVAKSYLQTHLLDHARGKGIHIVHHNAHTGETLYVCSVCERDFKHKYRLVSHMRTHTGVKPFECSVCEKSFTTKSILRRHMRNHAEDRPYVCSVCHKGFLHKYTLIRHMKTHTGEKAFKCSDCDKGFITKYYLKRHMKSHTGERSFVCTVCEKSFVHNYKLFSHMKSHSGEKPFKCSVCDKCFTGKSSLKVHEKSHR